MDVRFNPLGSTLREYRLHHNLEIQQMACMLGIDPRYLEDLEQGLTDLVSLEFLNRVLIQLNLPIHKVIYAVRMKPEMALWLALQNLVNTLIPCESQELIEWQVLSLLNKMAEIWILCRSIEEIKIWNSLMIELAESIYKLLAEKDAASTIYKAGPKAGSI